MKAISEANEHTHSSPFSVKVMTLLAVAWNGHVPHCLVWNVQPGLVHPYDSCSGVSGNQDDLINLEKQTSGIDANEMQAFLLEALEMITIETDHWFIYNFTRGKKQATKIFTSERIYAQVNRFSRGHTQGIFNAFA